MAILTGILILLIGIVHIIFGEVSQIPELMKHLDDPAIIGSVRVMIYQGGVILLGVGLLQFLRGLNRVQLRGVASWIPVGIIILNIFTFILVGLLFDLIVIRIAFPQLIIFLIIIVLMIVELRAYKARDKQ
ncbi:MAG: hypothetical protein JW814_07630 [Candidatus Krumholzibacteriota bacterium]|nr:hypothetical protein [Candidatus Krumholzibacteriota bacterium]